MPMALWNGLQGTEGVLSQVVCKGYEEGFEECTEVPSPMYAQETFDPNFAAQQAILWLTIALVIFEIWAVATGHNTISQALQRGFRKHPRLRWFAVIGFVFLAWHLLKGFPWSL